MSRCSNSGYVATNRVCGSPTIFEPTDAPRLAASLAARARLAAARPRNGSPQWTFENVGGPEKGGQRDFEASICGQGSSTRFEATWRGFRATRGWLRNPIRKPPNPHGGADPGACFSVGSCDVKRKFNADAVRKVSPASVSLARCTSPSTRRVTCTEIVGAKVYA